MDLTGDSPSFSNALRASPPAPAGPPGFSSRQETSGLISRPAPGGVTQRDIRLCCRKENLQASEEFGSTEDSCHIGRFSACMIQPLSHDHSLNSKVDCSILICFLISALVFASAPPATAHEEIHSLLKKLTEASGVGWDLIG